MEKIYFSARNMRSDRSGREVANQFIIETHYGTVFQSYRTIIAVRYNDGTIVLNETMWDCSKTTGKYRNQFLGETIKETRRKIDDGTYKLCKFDKV